MPRYRAGIAPEHSLHVPGPLSLTTPPMTLPIHQETSDIVRRYLQLFPDEASRFERLREQLASGEDLFVRSNMRGHATASVVVLNEAGTHVLLIAHKFLRKWLPPGGHYEVPGSLWDSACREVEEETGVTGIELHPWCIAHNLPLDIDTHAVPENPKKAEGPHFHHDFRFLATARNVGELVAQVEEVDGVRWASLAELEAFNDRRLTQLIRKLHAIGVFAAA